MDFNITLTLNTGQNIRVSSIISLKFTKERYTPHTLLSGKFHSDTLLGEVKSIILFIDNVQYHFGIPDKLEYELHDGMGIYSFSSRGYSCALAYNQLTPGLYSNVTVSSLLRSSIVLPNVSYENMTDSINYVYVKDNDTMWDAACAFSRKYSGDYPYIFGANTVRITKEQLDSLKISSTDIVSISQGQDYRRLVSHLHMRDLEGGYNTYNLSNPDAYNRNILRHQHIAFDRQWLSNPTEAMQSKIDYSMRGFRYKKLCYAGFNGEELRQSVNTGFSGIGIDGMEISKISLNLSKEGTFTTLWFYEDNYSQG